MRDDMKCCWLASCARRRTSRRHGMSRPRWRLGIRHTRCLLRNAASHNLRSPCKPTPAAAGHDVPFTDSHSLQSVTTFGVPIWVYSWLGPFVIAFATSLVNSQPCCAAGPPLQRGWACAVQCCAVLLLDPARSLGRKGRSISHHPPSTASFLPMHASRAGSKFQRSLARASGPPYTMLVATLLAGVARREQAHGQNPQAYAGIISAEILMPLLLVT